MDKDTLYKYYRKYYNFHEGIRYLIEFSEYHNHPEDFKEIQQEIELNELENMITTENILPVINKLNENVEITLDMIVYLSSETNRNVLYDYYLRNQKK